MYGRAVAMLRSCLVPFGSVVAVHSTDIQRGHEHGGDAYDEKASANDTPLETFEYEWAVGFIT